LEIVKHPSDEGAYFKEPHPKDSIFLHHSSGYFRPDWLINSWGRDRAESTNKIRSGSAFVIGGSDITSGNVKEFNGKVFSAFSPENWSHHLFIKARNNTFLNQKSIGIEICNYGELVKTSSGEFYTSSHIKVPENQVTILDSPFRGFKYFHSYTQEQIESLYDLLRNLSESFEIDLKRGMKREIAKTQLSLPKDLNKEEYLKWLNKNGLTDKFGKRFTEKSLDDKTIKEILEENKKDAFEVSQEALMGGQGLWSHTNVRADVKSIYPSPLIIQLINSL
jgi:hypothetical protein